MTVREEEPPRFDIGDEGGTDETDTNLRSYVESIPLAKLTTYRPDWTDEEVMKWEENFRYDGHLMLVCCTREVGVEQYRAEVEDRLRRVQQTQQQ